MFERLERRVVARARRRARERAELGADRLNAELPRGVIAEAVPDGVRLTGRGLRRRLVLDAAFRNLLAEMWR